jgi:hypothetical protein
MNNCTTKLETFTVTSKLTEILDQWNQTNSIGRQLGARVVGFIATPLTSLVDTVMHAALFAAKTVTGVVITPINIILKNPKLLDFELSSALVHLARTTESLFHIAILPFIALVNPSKAHALMTSRLSQKNEEIHQLQQKNKALQRKKGPLKNLRPQSGNSDELNKLKQENEALKAQHQEDQNQIEQLKQMYLLIRSVSPLKNMIYLNFMSFFKQINQNLLNNIPASHGPQIISQGIPEAPFLPDVLPSSKKTRTQINPTNESEQSKPKKKIALQQKGGIGDLAQEALTRAKNLRRAEVQAKDLMDKPETEGEKKLRERREKMEKQQAGPSTVQANQNEPNINLDAVLLNENCEESNLNLEDSVIFSGKGTADGIFEMEDVSDSDDNEQLSLQTRQSAREKSSPIAIKNSSNNPFDTMINQIPYISDISDQQKNEDQTAWDIPDDLIDQSYINTTANDNKSAEHDNEDNSSEKTNKKDKSPEPNGNVTGNMLVNHPTTNPVELGIIQNLKVIDQGKLNKAINTGLEALRRAKQNVENAIIKLKNNTDEDTWDAPVSDDNFTPLPDQLAYSVTMKRSLIDDQIKLKYYQERLLPAIKALIAMRI